MQTRTLPAVLLFLPTFSALAQERFDTMIKYNSYTPSYEKVKAFEPYEKEIRKYNEKGQVISITVYRRDMEIDELLRDYMITNTYGPNDSIKTSTYKWIPRGFYDWKTTEIRESTYQGSQLREIRITDSAYSEWGRSWKKESAKKLEPFFPGVSVRDTSGWTDNSVIKFEYDNQNRIIKKSHYLDVNYNRPSTTWNYHYDQKYLPEVNTNIEDFSVIRSAYHYLYKGGRLHKYRENKYSGAAIKIKTDEYGYSPDGQLEKLFNSHEEMQLVKVGKKVYYKTSEKERLYHKQFFEYKNGVISSVKEESLVATTVNKSTFWDRLAAIRTNTSTFRYGDVERTTTTTTIEPVGTTEKTKYSWEKATTEYHYNAAGKLAMTKTGNTVTGYTYDSKGRTIEIKTIFPDKLTLAAKPGEYSGPSVTITKTVYSYNK